MLVSRSISHRAIALVSVLLTFELVFIGTLAYMLQQSEYEAWREQSSKEKIAAATLIGRNFSDAVQLLLSYGLGPSPEIANRYENNLSAIVNGFKNVGRLMVDDPVQLKNLRVLEISGNEGLHIMNDTKVAMDRNDQGFWLTHGVTFRAEIQGALKRFMTVMKVMVKHEQESADEGLLSGTRWRARVRDWLFAGVTINVLLAGGMVFLFMKGITSRLSLIVDNANRLARQEPLHEPMEGKDEITILDSVFHDMSAALTEHARRERAVVDNALDVICSLDRRGVFLKLNPAAEKVWGYTPAELLNNQVTSILPPKSIDKTEEALSNMIKNKETATTFENQILKKDGTLLDALWSVTWPANEQALFCVVHDLTARKETERMKEEFLAMISHDLRTPLTSVQFSLRLTKMGAENLSEELLEELSVAERNTERMLKLINELLNVQKIESGRFSLVLEPIEIEELIYRSIESVQGLAQSNNITLKAQTADYEVDADGERLTEVVVNLLSNAVKFSPAGGTVTVQVTLADPAGEEKLQPLATPKPRAQELEVRVIDQGIGIPREHLQSVFDRFQQVRRSDERQKGGSGLGLAICKVIIDAHGGTIGVESEEGKGSSFWFRLPFEKADRPS
jgi:PAS domain S-box-containing protein